MSALADGPVLVRVLQEEARLKVEASWRTVERTAGKLGVVGSGEQQEPDVGTAKRCRSIHDIPT